MNLPLALLLRNCLVCSAALVRIGIAAWGAVCLSYRSGAFPVASWARLVDQLRDSCCGRSWRSGVGLLHLADRAYLGTAAPGLSTIGAGSYVAVAAVHSDGSSELCAQLVAQQRPQLVLGVVTRDALANVGVEVLGACAGAFTGYGEAVAQDEYAERQ